VSEFAIGLLTLACVYAGALAGLRLQRRLPEHHLRDDSKDVVRLVSGLLATLSALVLGLLIASAKGAYDQVSDGIRQSAAKVVVIDRLLGEYGPEAKPARAQLKLHYAQRFAQLFPDRRSPGNVTDTLPDSSSLDAFVASLRALSPENDAQRHALSRIRQLVDDLTMERWLTFEKAHSSVPPGLLVVLVSWLAVMFASFGLFAPRNATALTALFIGALAVSTSIFLIEEMNRPFEGWIALSADTMGTTLAVLGR
jgi:hypothetical protein